MLLMDPGYLRCILGNPRLKCGTKAQLNLLVRCNFSGMPTDSPFMVNSSSPTRFFNAHRCYHPLPPHHPRPRPQPDTGYHPGDDVVCVEETATTVLPSPTPPHCSTRDKAYWVTLAFRAFIAAIDLRSTDSSSLLFL